MIKKFLVGLLSASAAVGLALGSAVPAQAVVKVKPNAISITKISNKTVSSKRATATLKPTVVAGKNVKIVSKRITVKQGSRTRAKNVASYKAKPGTYKITSTVKYQVKSTKKVLVTNGAKNTKKIPMRCTITDTETYYDFQESGLDLEWFSFECTGSAFDGKYKANAAYVYPNETSYLWGLDMLWGESFPSEPVIYPYVGRTFNITAVPKDGKLYKSKTVYSGTKTASKSQTVKVTVRRR